MRNFYTCLLFLVVLILSSCQKELSPQEIEKQNRTKVNAIIERYDAEEWGAMEWDKEMLSEPIPAEVLDSFEQVLATIAARRKAESTGQSFQAVFNGALSRITFEISSEENAPKDKERRYAEFLQKHTKLKKEFGVYIPAGSAQKMPQLPSVEYHRKLFNLVNEYPDLFLFTERKDMEEGLHRSEQD